MTLEKLTLTRKEAAAILGISTATVSQWVKTGRLRAIKISEKENSRYLFTREDCIAALEFGKVEFRAARPATSPQLTPPPTSHQPGHFKHNDLTKRLDEILKIRNVNAKRRSSD